MIRKAAHNRTQFAPTKAGLFSEQLANPCDEKYMSEDE